MARARSGNGRERSTPSSPPTRAVGDRQIIKIRRTAAASPVPPADLEPGELAIGMAVSPAAVWCGVPPAIDANGHIKLLGDDVYLTEPTADGVWLRQRAAGPVYSWTRNVTMAAATDTLAFTKPAAFITPVMTFTGDGTSGSSVVRITNNVGSHLTGLNISNLGTGFGLNAGNMVAGGIAIASSAGSGIGINASASLGVAINITGTGAQPWLRIQEGTDDRLRFGLTGLQLWNGTSMQVIGIGTVNPASTYVIPERTALIPPGGTQYQALVKGTGTAFGWAYAGERSDNNWGFGSSNFATVTGTPSDNIAIGVGAIRTVGAGTSTNNIAIGTDALPSINSDALDCIAIGREALRSGLPQKESIGIGYRAGYLSGALPGSLSSIYIGTNALASGTYRVNEIVIGASATGRGNNTVTLGTDAITQLWCGGRDILAATAPGQYLPLSGGTMTTVTGGQERIVGTVNANSTASFIHVHNTGTVGMAFRITNSGNAAGIYIDNTIASTNAALGLYIHNRVGGSGISVQNFDSGRALNIENSGGGQGIRVSNSTDGTALDINNTGTGNSLRIRSGATNHFVIAANGVITAGAPTGPAVPAGPNINIQGGYYINGVPMTAGATISATEPTNPAPGQLWWDNDDGGLYIWFQNAWVGVT